MKNIFPLFDFFPELKSISKLNLGNYPTPIQKLTNLEKKINCTSNIYIKRDDLTSNIYGGNKVRKLEFTLADAINKKATRIITGGGNGSNMTVAVSIFSKKLGINVNSVFFPQPINNHVKTNFELNNFFGSKIHISSNKISFFYKIIEKMIYYTIKDKKIPYLIIPGDSNALSSLGYVNCVFEILEQIKNNEISEPDYIFVSLGSCGTTSGLLAGLKICNLKSKLVAVSVSDKIISNKKNIIRHTTKIIDFISKKSLKKLDIKINDDDITVLYDYLGKGYGHEIPELYNIIKLLDETENIKLDPTYTGKTMVAMLDFIKKVENKNILFINTYNSINF
ncbi:MAG: pyridoxal-phosphate dependent enzyme [Cyanobacteriota bacterium]